MKHLAPILLVSCLSIAWAAPTSAQEVRVDDNLGDELDWVVVPNVKFNDDAGFIYGLKAELVRQDPELEPFAWELRLKLTHSTRNRHEHSLRLDLPDAFGSHSRLVLLAEFVKIDDALYFGIGNQTAREGSDQPHRFGLAEPRLSLNLRRKLYGDFFIGGGLDFHASIIDAPPQGLLAQEAPRGVEGSHALQALIAVGYDSRDNELTPTEGHQTELYLKGATGPLVTSHAYVGLGLNHSSFVPLTSWLVLAQRVVFEDLSGDVPVGELYRLGGSQSVRALGGVHSQRGFAEGRFIGRTKALSNSEVRFYLPRMFDGRLGVGLGPFVDVSRVLDGEGVGDLFDDLHVSGGGELTLIWKRSFLMRVDYARSEEGGLLYIQGRHLF